MKKVIRILLLAFLALLILIQFIPFEKPSNHPTTGKDIFEIADLPEDVGLILKNVCYDCHSQEVNFPWYSNVAPVSWLVAKDVREGREELDFSKWGDLSKKEKLKKLDEIGEEVENKNMPLKIYTVMHAESRLTQAERDAIVTWEEAFAEEILEE
jgi:hypothetical protein